MAELTYTGRGGGPSGVAGPNAASPSQQQQPAHQQQQRPSTASPRLPGHSRATREATRTAHHGTPDRPPSARHMLAFLDRAEGAAAGAAQPSMFPFSGVHLTSAEAGAGDRGLGRNAGGGGGGSRRQQRERPRSAAPLRVSGGSRVRPGRLDLPSPPPPPPHRQWGRVSLYDHASAEHPPHLVPGPTILRNLDKAKVGFPARPPEDFLRSGEGLTLRQRNKLKDHLGSFPVKHEAPFVPGTGGVRMSHDAMFAASAPPTSRHPLPHSLLRTYYDNGTLDFVSVRWRGSRADALAWARAITKGPERSAHARSFTAWSHEAPGEVDVPTWLPIFIDGIREYEEPYRFLAIRGAEELLLKAADTLHTFADSLVSPLKTALDTREPTTVAVALQLMNAALELDSQVAVEWTPHYWQWAQVLNLFRSRGGALVVDMGYNKRDIASCRELATAFMTAFEIAGGPLATAAVRRYSPGHDPAVTDASMTRAATKAATKAVEAGLEPGSFKPFTLF